MGTNDKNDTQEIDTSRRNVSVPDEIWENVKVLAIRTKRTVSETVSDLLADAIQKAEEGQ